MSDDWRYAFTCWTYGMTNPRDRRRGHCYLGWGMGEILKDVRHIWQGLADDSIAEHSEIRSHRCSQPSTNSTPSFSDGNNPLHQGLDVLL